jgi:hypothetical protein
LTDSAKEVGAMTIIELNIAGLHVTRSAPGFSREVFKRSYRALRHNVAHWPAAHIRTRRAPDRSAA